MILSLVNEEPRSVFSKGGFYLNNNVADVTVTSLDFPSGIKSHIFVSWLHPYKRQELVLVGEKKMAVLDDTKNWDEKLLIYPLELNWKDGLPVPNKKEAEKIFLEESEPLKNECRHFISCILNNTKPITDGEEGLKVIKVLEASQKSLDSEKIIYFNDMFNYKNSEGNYFVHESSYVDKEAKIGSGTKIWHFSHIMSGAVIGKNCSIGQNVSIGSKAVIGNNVKILLLKKHFLVLHLPVTVSWKYREEQNSIIYFPLFLFYPGLIY
ncbi:UDP-3-O-(3-hydroxymyristoyl)glucosamine N-acyltransferase [subsurface metagenome]